MRQTVLEFFSNPVLSEMAPGVPIPSAQMRLVAGMPVEFGAEILKAVEHQSYPTGLGGNPLAEKLMAFGVQHNAFNLGAAQINTDSIHRAIPFTTRSVPVPLS